MEPQKQELSFSLKFQCQKISNLPQLRDPLQQKYLHEIYYEISYKPALGV